PRPREPGWANEGRKWCPGEDSNLHGSLHWYLKPARLPIPPPGQGWESGTGGPGRGAQSTGGIPGCQQTAERDEVDEENQEITANRQAFARRAGRALTVAAGRGPRRDDAARGRAAAQFRGAGGANGPRRQGRAPPSAGAARRAAARRRDHSQPPRRVLPA